MSKSITYYGDTFIAIPSKGNDCSKIKMAEFHVKHGILGHVYKFTIQDEDFLTSVAKALEDNTGIWKMEIKFFKR